MGSLQFTLDEKRQRLLMFLVMLRGGSDGLRCGKRNDQAARKGSTTWGQFPGELSVQQVHLRSILPQQVVFDVGDCSEPSCEQAGHVRCWQEKALGNALPIMQALDEMGVPFVASLSGGKGIHVEVFADEAPATYSTMVGESIVEDDGRPDWRRRFASEVLSRASIIRGEAVVADPRLKSPNDSSHLVRDWGQRKVDWSDKTKRVWSRGLGFPSARGEAYEMVPHGPDAIPDHIPICAGLARRYSLGAKGCPKTAACFDPTSNDGWPGCGDCPRWN